MKLILFDIDGTLIETGGAGRRALNLAMQDLYEMDDAFSDLDLAGKTDLQIIKEGLAKLGPEIDLEKNVKKVTSAYIKNLRIEIKKRNKSVLPGIKKLLQKLKESDKAAIGLLTGNIRRGAKIKLDAFGLYPYFKSGAFGNDDEERNNLLPIAVKRFEKILKREISFKDCVVVGDTPRDIECARVHGAFSFAVATGIYSYYDLGMRGANYAVNDLLDPSPILDLLR